MFRSLSAVLFAVAFLAGILLGSLYMRRRMVRDAGLSPWAGRALTALLAAGGLLLPVAFVLSRLDLKGAVCPLVFLAFAWLGFMFYAIFLLSMGDLGRGLYRVARWVWIKLDAEAKDKGQDPGSSAWKQSGPVPRDPERRRFFARVVASTATVGAGAVSIMGLQTDPGQIQTPEVPIRLGRLPAAFSGFRIALLSDLHIGPTLRHRFTRMVVERTNRLKPDLVAITGDLVDGPVSVLGDDVAPLAGLRARYGVFFSTGNHEYYSGVEEWQRFLGRLGVTVLGNRRVSVADPVGARKGFDLAGLTDLHGGWFQPGHRPDVVPIINGRDEERELVLMAHQPAQIKQAVKARPGLVLSGHTHGGQIWPWTFMVHLNQPYVQGLHRHDEWTQIYVTRGVGYWGPPIRFLAPAEITLIVLVAG